MIRASVIVLLAVIGVGIVAGVGCGETSEPGGETVTGNPEAQYNTVLPQIQNAVTAYMVETMGELPPTVGTVTVDGQTYDIFDICSLVGEDELLRTLPDGCAEVSGAGNDNCDMGSCECDSSAHYVWVVDDVGNVYSTCRGRICDANNADGFQGVWP